MNIGMQYQWLRRVLKNMDEKQLLELFHDIDDIEAVQRIADCAYHHVENFEREVEEIVNPKSYSEFKEWEEQDNAQRYADIKAEQDR